MAAAKEDLALHKLVFTRDAAGLRAALSTSKHNVEELDHYKRTPLRLAVLLESVDCVQVLLEFGASVNGVDIDGWSAVHDATCTANHALLKKILEERAKAQQEVAKERIPQLLQLLESDRDFYVEMTWDFTSWIPLVSRLCPSDVCRIWKRGCTVRVDTTLLGYSNLRWIRGNRSFLFRCKPGSKTAAANFEMIVIDHDRKMVIAEDLFTLGSDAGSVDDEDVQHRLETPVVVTTLNPNTVGFSRVRTGLWGFQSDKTEQVGSVTAKVYSVSGLEIVTKTRYEHLPRTHPARKKLRSPLSQVMGGLLGSEEAASTCLGTAPEVQHDDHVLEQGRECSGADEYLRSSPTDHPVCVGRAIEQRIQRQSFKVQMWMSEDFPLSLQRQVLPIIDLMAPTSQHIAKLRDFISLQLPPGFPVKIEIPVYHLVNARVTFDHYSSEVDPALLEVPEDYATTSPAPHAASGEIDPMLAMALQYSLADTHDQYADEEEMLQRALALSLQEQGGAGAGAGGAAGAGAAAGHATLAPIERAIVAAAPTAEWACDSCTYINAAGHTRCEICQQPSPLSARPTAASVPVPSGHVHSQGHGRGAGDVTGRHAEDAQLQMAIAASMADRGRGHGSAAPADEDDELMRVLELSKHVK